MFPPLNLSAESVQSNGRYLLDNSLALLLWAIPKLCLLRPFGVRVGQKLARQ